MPEKSDPRVEETLTRLQLDLDRLKDALNLLGVSACSWCEKYFRRTDPGAIFDAGKPVCYGCIPQWWPQCCAQLRGKDGEDEDREDIESRLVIWLRQHHHAELFKDPAKLPDSSLQEVHIVAKCLECHGTGLLMGKEKCRFCEGHGTVSVIVLRKQG
jgi:hypothetical protein